MQASNPHRLISDLRRCILLAPRPYHSYFQAMNENGKFNQKETSAFKSGGMYSTPHKRETEAKASDFLMPAERKYPYKSGGKISCNLLKAAISRAAQNNEPAVKARATSLYNEHC